ncbi:MAG: 2-dehydropantoate 2-reductase [Marine Group II euryarchaeote MED-G33]|nr:MAG: 2-dehydropantoate 2-reductase [Marine Group II euryarchaeote MED-G33]
MMRVAVLGVGAIGGLVASRLARSGCEVLLCARGETAQALAAVGLLLDTPDGRTIALAPDRWSVFDTNQQEIPVEIQGWADYAILCGKSYDIAELCKMADTILSLNGVAMCLSNGIGHMEKLANFVGKHRVLGASTTHGAIRIGPGEVHWTSRGTLVMGGLAGSDLEPVEPRIDSLMSALDEAGLNPIWSEDIDKKIWLKLLLNVAINPVCAISGILNGEMLLQPELFETGLAAMEEAARIATAEGVDLSDFDLAQSLEDLCRATADNRVSMLQDIMAGRPTEIDSICGEVVKRGEALGIPTPRNQTLHALVKGIEQSTRV